MRKNKDTGDLGEKAAKEYLIKNKYKIIETNYHGGKFGEVDIIALDKDELVFVEVKTRKTLNFGHPFESITSKKLQNLQNAIYSYMNKCDKKYKSFRIDVIGIILEDSLKIEHLKNVSLN